MGTLHLQWAAWQRLAGCSVCYRQVIQPGRAPHERHVSAATGARADGSCDWAWPLAVCCNCGDARPGRQRVAEPVEWHGKVSRMCMAQW